LQDKVAIVTGSSSGLGRAIATRYAQEGAKVVCADLTPTARSQEEADTTTHDLIIRDGGQATFVRTDVGDATQMEHLVRVAAKEYGRLDMYGSPARRSRITHLMTSLSLVNNAGISIEARTPAVLHLTDETTWDTTMRVNTKSVFLGCKYALTQMLAQEPHSSGDRGWIINIPSIMGMIGGPENRESNSSTLGSKLILEASIVLCIKRCCE
jgi:NAD(P)-dependent dehydrogenase (short-subunit alcohol dehydrogenase family)